MWATAWLRRFWPETAWVVFVLVCVAGVMALPGQVPVPFHLIWVSLALLYGFRVWQLSRAVVVGLATAVVSGLALTVSIQEGHSHPDEYTEIPLMAVLFFAMVWHARRRQAAVEQAACLIDERRRILNREQEFLRDASHQLRTPITIARGHTELLVEELVGPPRADAEVVLDELVRLGSVAERLLMLQASERPEFLSQTPLDPAAVLERTASRWEGVTARAWSVQVRGSGVVVADDERLASALDALVENAVAFTEPGDHIRLSARVRADEVVFVVEDGGPGIRPGATDHVFERFWSDGSGRREGRGTGLGLAIVRAVARAHGGEASAGSSDLGGARMSLRLPAGAANGVPGIAAAGARTAEQHGTLVPNSADLA
jgi:signal transduction histidine kinase